MERWQPSGREERRDASDPRRDRARGGRRPRPPVAPTPTTLLDLLPHPAFAVAVDGDDVFRFIYTNDAYRGCSATTPSATAPATCAASCRPTRSSRTSRAFARAAARAADRRSSAEWGAPIPTRRVAVDVTPIVGADGACELLGAVYDVSEHRRIEAELAHRTRHDPLTELPNRVMLVEWLQQALLACTRADAARVGLVLLDIDHFKVVNDSLGHEAGDELLAAAAQRVERVLRAGDRLARLGGDELAVVCHNVRRSTT